MAEGPQLLTDARCHHLQWFSVRTGIDFLSVTATARVVLDPPSGCFCAPERAAHGGLLEPERGFKKSAKGLEPIPVPNLGGAFCLGNERRAGKSRAKGNRCYNPGGRRLPCRGCKAVTPAQEVPLLPDHQLNGGLVCAEGPAGPQLTGKDSLLSGGRRRGDP